jgi:regulator of cell morphogenesis and NO signaling
MERMTLAQLVTDLPGASEVFLRFGLDFCCRGQRTLAEACREGGQDAREVLAALSEPPVGQARGGGLADLPLSELVGHVLERYHAPLRRELPALRALALRVEEVHAGRPACPSGLAALLERVEAAVEQHLAKEEQILFPAILAGRGDTAHMPIKVMMQEHEDHGANLRRIRELTRGLEPPAEACPSWRELYRGLARLEAELFSHIHLENYVLFPRALAGEGARRRP